MHEKIASIIYEKNNVFSSLEPVIQINFTDTREIAAGSGMHTVAKSKMTFTLPKTMRLIASIAFPVAATTLISYNHLDLVRDLFLGGLALVFIYLPMLTYYWLSDRFKDRITITDKGIIFENYYYRWDKIIETYIKEVKVHKGEGSETRYYLTLGMSNGTLIDLNIMPFTFTKKFFTTQKTEIKALCSWVEYFKTRQDLTAIPA